MSKPKYTPYQLLDFGGAEFCIQCSDCKMEKRHYLTVDEDQITEVLFLKGWRATRQKCYCPECAKKKLKL